MSNHQPHILTSRYVATHAAIGSLFALAALLLLPAFGGDIDVLAAFKAGPSSATSSPDALIYWNTRVPRVLLSLLAGGALAIAGLIFQAVLRNPLAEPYILGISGGAALGKLIASIVGLSGVASALALTPVFCFAGALVPLAVLFSLASTLRHVSSATLLLGGVMLNVFFTSLIVLIQYFADLAQVRQMFLWSMGALDVVGYREIAVVAPACLLITAFVMAKGRTLNVLSLDVLSAAHLGINIKRESAILLLLGALLTSLMVAVSGPIGFVGLLVPHALRLVFSPDHRLLVPLCGLYGGVFLAVCDFIGWRGMELLQRAGMNLPQTSEIPVGIITSVLGGPFFFYLLLRHSRRMDIA